MTLDELVAELTVEQLPTYAETKARMRKAASRLLAMQEALVEAQEALVFTKNWIRSECLVGRVTDAPLALSDCEGALAKVTALLSPNRSGGGDAKAD
jgi:hypothetical protein